MNWSLDTKYGGNFQTGIQRYASYPQFRDDCKELNYFLHSGILRLIMVMHRLGIENRIYREELKESLGMNFFSPFQPKREFKVYKSCKCSQIMCSRVH